MRRAASLLAHRSASADEACKCPHTSVLMSWPLLACSRPSQAPDHSWGGATSQRFTSHHFLRQRRSAGGPGLLPPRPPRIPWSRPPRAGEEWCNTRRCAVHVSPPGRPPYCQGYPGASEPARIEGPVPAGRRSCPLLPPAIPPRLCSPSTSGPGPGIRTKRPASAAMLHRILRGHRPVTRGRFRLGPGHAFHSSVRLWSESREWQVHARVLPPGQGQVWSRGRYSVPPRSRPGSRSGSGERPPPQRPLQVAGCDDAGHLTAG